jgi:hypothetical protein
MEIAQIILNKRALVVDKSRFDKETELSEVLFVEVTRNENVLVSFGNVVGGIEDRYGLWKTKEDISKIILIEYLDP